MNDNSSNKAMSHPSQSTVNEAPVVSIEALLTTNREVVILHEGERYRLRITSNNKLILTK